MQARSGSILAIAALLAAAGVGCSSGSGSDSAVGSSASCVASLVFDGHVYIGQRAATSVTEGRSLGPGTFPSCNDTGSAATNEPEEEIEIAEIEDVPASIAVIQRGNVENVYIRDDVDRRSLPDGLVAVIRPLRCRHADEPIRFVAEMRGIAPVGFGQEFDFRAPFDLWVHVTESVPPRYERGSVRVRVPAALGRPLTAADVDTLWNGARLALTIHCRDSGYIAVRVAVRRS